MIIGINVEKLPNGAYNLSAIHNGLRYHKMYFGSLTEAKKDFKKYLNIKQ